MPIYHINLGFAGLPDADLDAFTENVIAKLTISHTVFPSPPVTVEDLQTALDEFTAAITAAADGGKMNTVLKDAAREVVVDALRRDAAYVQVHADNDLATLLLSGYDASSTSRTRTTLLPPVVTSVENGISTTLVIHADPVRNARSYEVQVSSNGGTSWIHAVTSTKAREITVAGLTPGTTYQLQVRSVGGLTGHSGWSNPIAHMAT